MEKKIRLLILASHMERGETSDYIIDVARYLQTKGLISVVISAGGYEVNRLRRYGITHIQAPTHSRNPLSLFAAYSEIKDIIKKYEINLIHVHTPLTGWLAYFLRKKLNIPYIATLHYPYARKPEKKQIVSPITRYFLKGLLSANHVFTSFSYLMNFIKKDFDLKDKVSHLPRWTDAQYFSPENIAHERLIALTQKWNVPDGLPLILNISEEENSNDSLFLQALSQLPHRNFGVIMIRNWTHESHPLFVKMKQEALKLNVYKNISVVLPEDDEPLMYKIADLIVCPTTVSFARISLQAQAMGKIILLPAVSGASDYVETGKTGRLFIENESKSLSDSILWGLNLTGTTRHEITQSARYFAKTQDKNHILPHFFKICNKLI